MKKYKYIPENVRNLAGHDVSDISSCMQDCSFVFSALDSDGAKIWEEKYAKAGLPVVSNASTHKHTKDVPVLFQRSNKNGVMEISRTIGKPWRNPLF